MDIDEDVPILLAPALINSTAKSAVLIPPDALILTVGGNAPRMIFTCSVFAPVGAKPVDVFTK